MNSRKFYILADAHIDIAYNTLMGGRDFTLSVQETRRQEQATQHQRHVVGTCTVGLPTLLEGNIALVGASIFTMPAKKWGKNDPTAYHNTEEAHSQAVAQLDYYRRLNDEDERVTVVHTKADLDLVLQTWKNKAPQLGMFIVMEGADPISTPSELAWWVERGLRGVALAWSTGSRYAGGNANPGPLTDEGRELLNIMADYNLLLDLSHLWEEAVYESLGSYPGPIAATHSPPRVFNASPRGLADDQIRRIAGRGGVIGVAPCNSMLDAHWQHGEPRLPLSRFVEAIDHICQVVGHAESVGIGSDLDGGFGRESVPAGLDSIADLIKVSDLLLAKGYTEVAVEAILSRNWLRLMGEVLNRF